LITNLVTVLDMVSPTDAEKICPSKIA